MLLELPAPLAWDNFHQLKPFRDGVLHGLFQRRFDGAAVAIDIVQIELQSAHHSLQQADLHDTLRRSFIPPPALPPG